MRYLLFLSLALGALSLSEQANATNQRQIELSTPTLAPHLRCFVTYADQTEVIDSFLQSSPYEITPINIGGRFTFKAVMIGHKNTINYIALYAYFQASPKDRPIHEAIYRGPFQVTSQWSQLTPYNHLYAGDVERELTYYCKLSAVQK